MMNLRKLRLAMGLTQADVADKMGVAQKTISNWETGLKSPSLYQAQKLAEFYDVPLDYMTFPANRKRGVTGDTEQETG